MTAIELAKLALKHVTYESFNLDVYASTGGKCDTGWGDHLDLSLSREALLYLISNKSQHDELFEDLELEEVDVDSIINEIAMESAWPNGGPGALVDNVIPKELETLADALESVDDSDDDAIIALRDELSQVTSGKYTFSFTIDADGYYFAEGVEEKIELTRDEILGLLYSQYKECRAFEGICSTMYTEDLINKKAEAIGFADNYDTFTYDGSSEQLDVYLESWDYILDNILNGEIVEEDLAKWLAYFDDSSNFDCDITEWMER